MDLEESRGCLDEFAQSTPSLVVAEVEFQVARFQHLNTFVSTKFIWKFQEIARLILYST